MKIRDAVTGIVVLLLIAGGTWYFLRTPTVHVSLGTTRITVEVADDPTEREQGLSGHSPISDAEGMLFVFQEDGKHEFWMKDMLFPIDIIWLDANKRVIYVVANATPESYPNSYGPNAPSRYVLEVPAGWASRYGVDTGATARFQ